MEYFVVTMIIISICAFYIAYKATKSYKAIKSKKKTKDKNKAPNNNIQQEYKPSSTVQALLKESDYHKPIKLYPDLSCEIINIFSKKACKEYNNFTVIDFETTGLKPTVDSIVEIGAVKIIGCVISDSFSTLVNPEHKIPLSATKINGITDEMVKDAPVIKNVLPRLMDFIGDDVLVAHNASFDIKFLLANAYDCGIEIKNPVIDTLALSRKMFPDLPNHKLETITKHLCIDMN